MNIIYFPSTSEIGLVEAGTVCGKQDNVDFGGKGELEGWRPHNPCLGDSYVTSNHGEGHVTCLMD